MKNSMRPSKTGYGKPVYGGNMKPKDFMSTPMASFPAPGATKKKPKTTKKK